MNIFRGSGLNIQTKPARRRAVFLHPSALLGLTALLAAGCNFNKPYPAKLSYIVAATRPEAPPDARTGALLQIHTLRMDAAFEGKAFIYRLGELQYESDFYHEFLVPPRLLLTEQVRQWLGASGLFRAVLDPASKAEATLDLEGNVHALYADFRDKSAPKAVLAMEFFLMKPESAGPVFHKIYRENAALEGKGPGALAKGWSSALSRILAALERDLASIPLPK